MGFTMQCFTIEELEELDPAQLEVLRHAIEREIGNNPDIQKILRQKLDPTYTRMAGPRKKSASGSKTTKRGSK